MPKRKKRFAEDGWAIWVEGEDTSTIYINDWLNPMGKSYVDIAVRICFVEKSKYLYVYVPFSVSEEEIEDISLKFCDKKIVRATFSAECIMDVKKNAHTSEIAYNGKTIDVIHISTFSYEVKPLANGTLIGIDLEKLKSFLDNDEVYFVWRMPHKSINEVFRGNVDVKKALERLQDLITTPVVSEKYGYSIRINEARLLPPEINEIEVLHEQRIRKALITITLGDEYEMNDSTCYRIRRLEAELNREYAPEEYDCSNAITYQWVEERDSNMKAHYNFYFTMEHNKISKLSMMIYLLVVFFCGAFGSALYDLIKFIVSLL